MKQSSASLITTIYTIVGWMRREISEGGGVEYGSLYEAVYPVRESDHRKRW